MHKACAVCSETLTGSIVFGFNLSEGRGCLLPEGALALGAFVRLPPVAILS